MPRLTAEGKQIWEERIRDYQISGLSLKKYCEQADLAYHRMQYHWKQHANLQQNKEIPSRFAPVNISPSPQRIEVYFPSGIKCVLPYSIDRASLQLIKDILTYDATREY